MMVESANSAAGDGAAGRGWWAVYTRHQHEKTVAEVISAKGLEVFLPLYDSVRHWKDRNTRISLPLFPSYVFVRQGSDLRLPVVSTPGVNMIVTLGGRLATVSEAEIAALRRATQASAKVEPHPFLRCGERVRVKRGPLEGLEGILVRKKNLCRLVLSIDMLARAAAVEVDAWDVCPISNSAHSMSPAMATSRYVTELS